jgi:membrane carboxypeptidase/penicillin-binding protein PbpC
VGAEAALPLAGQVFRRLPPNPAPAWPDPEGELQPVKVCAVSGLPCSTWCERTRTALIPRRQFLNRICDVHWPAPARRIADAGGITDAAPPATIERWPGSARGWDLARVGAPPITGPTQTTTAHTSTVHALQILNPPGGARFILTGERNGDRIPLRASGDEQGPVHWYLNGRFLATTQPRQSLLLDLTPGNHKLVCMTPQGTTAQVRFQVAQPAASNPDFERRP